MRRLMLALVGLSTFFTSTTAALAGPGYGGYHNGYHNGHHHGHFVPPARVVYRPPYYYNGFNGYAQPYVAGYGAPGCAVGAPVVAGYPQVGFGIGGRNFSLWFQQ